MTEQSFLAPVVIHCYFQTIGSWAAKIGKMYYEKSYLAKYRRHDNTAGNKPAFNNGFYLLSE